MDTPASERSSPSPRLTALRAAMRAAAVDAVWVPSSDPHLSEYLPERWQGRAWLSGFTGSVGNLVVTADFAGLWVDSRYWIQAEAQLAGSGIAVMRVASAGSAGHLEWLAQQLAPGQTVAVDGAVAGLKAARHLQSLLQARGIGLRTDLDLLDAAWPDRAGLPTAPVYEHPAPYACTTRADKLAAVRAALDEAGADWHFISTLDDVAWLFNLRGSDVPYNPVFLAHALIGPSGATLFMAPGKASRNLVEDLQRDGVRLAAYEEAARALAALPDGARLLLDPGRITWGLRQAVPSGVKTVEAINPSTLLKSRKTAAEAAHIRQAMEEDGAALAEFFAWFEQALGRETITELTVDERLIAARARRAGFVSPSFATIAALNANGAMPHYRATQQSHATICTPQDVADGLLLIDSGGQYLNGTTDITRVVPVGRTTPEQRRDFTLVLKAMIALSMARFPVGTRAPALDAIARAPIWAAGVDYGHGTGHGVGYFLNVHEGPQAISPHLAPEPHTAMQAGMITSNEPGIYRPGKWGVRIENLVLNVPASSTEFGDFLGFETLTLCPIDTRCIEPGLLTADEGAWLNSYHNWVRTRLSAHVQGDARAWLEKRTEPIATPPVRNT
jgi:Xaa-Pro aminopeptidase